MLELSDLSKNDQLRSSLLSGFNDPMFVEYYEQTDNSRQIDLPFYRSLAAKVTGPVLDAGCGSGRILVPLVEAGVEMHGFDVSELMLSKLRTRLSEKGLTARLSNGSLTDFDMLGQEYELVICSFNTFLHLMSHEDQLRSLRKIKAALKPSGRFVFDITNPYNFDIFSRKAMAKTFEATLYNPATDKETNIWRWFERDLISQTGIYHREYEHHSSAGVSSHETSINFRWTYPTEMELLLAAVGFTSTECFGDFDRSPLTEESEMQVWIATK